MRCVTPGFSAEYCGLTWKFEVWMFFSATPARLSASKTAFMARAFAASAAAAEGARVTTPVESCARSGASLTSPRPLTLMRRGAAALSAQAAGAAAARHSDRASAMRDIVTMRSFFTEIALSFARDKAKLGRRGQLYSDPRRILLRRAWGL